MCFCIKSFTSVFTVKEPVEVEELDERDEDEENEAVPVVSESYINLRKKMVTKHNPRLDNVLQENGKLIREFYTKKVKENCFDWFIYSYYYIIFQLSIYYNVLLFSPASLHPVIQALQVHAGGQEEPAGLARKREHPRRFGPVSGAGGQWDDRVGHTEKQVFAFTKIHREEVLFIQSLFGLIYLK